MNVFMKSFLSKCIMIFLVLWLMVIYMNKHLLPEGIKESIQNYGHKKKEKHAPLAYKSFAMSLKYPTIGKNVDPVYEEITSTYPYVPKVFNGRENRKYYSQSEMMNDFKYFNNASNLRLQRIFNETE